MGCPHGSCDGADLNNCSAAYWRVLWIALAANAAMFLVEVVAGFRANSAALLADAVDFFADSANYGLSLFVLQMGLSARAKATIFKGVCMGSLGVGILGVATYNFVTQSQPEPTTMGAVAVMALSVNVFVALLLFRFRDGDSNRRSVWLCSRNDAIANVAVLFAALLVAQEGANWPDLVVACLIAGLAITSSVSVVRQAREELRADVDST